LILRENGLKAFQNSVLRKILRREAAEVTRGMKESVQ
jgi:hypothetical protein